MIDCLLGGLLRWLGALWVLLVTMDLGALMVGVDPTHALQREVLGDGFGIAARAVPLVHSAAPVIAPICTFPIADVPVSLWVYQVGPAKP